MVLAFSGIILAQSILVARNIIFDALLSFCKGTIYGRVICSEMYCSKFVLFLALFLAFLAQSILEAGNIIFNALVSLCKSIMFGRVIRCETRCCNLVSFLAFSGIILV